MNGVYVIKNSDEVLIIRHHDGGNIVIVLDKDEVVEVTRKLKNLASRV